jgi:enterochelin esterase-like enzyme
LNTGTEGHWGHVNIRGDVLWESQTFSDDRVLLHIPPGFDPKRPAVMVVFFHGHGADLTQDVYDRQQVPAQITAAGVNARRIAAGIGKLPELAPILMTRRQQ